MKPGRPKKNEKRDELHVVTFKAGGDVLDAIERLTALEVKRGARSAKSTAIRRAILETDERRRKEGDR